MANPVLTDLTGPAADALSGTTNPGTGIKHLSAAADDASTPTHFQRMMQQAAHIFELLSRFGGAVVHLGGLDVGVFALEYEIAATERSFAGVASQAMTASQTNYLWLDADQVLEVSTSGWPAGAHFRLAKVVCGASAVTSITDVRMQNFQRGGNAWYSIAAAADVDFANFLGKNVAGIVLSASTELTLASDAITPTRELHTVDTQSNAAADDLVTLTADAAKIGRKVILRAENASRVVTVKSTGNIQLIDGDCVLDSLSKNIELLQDTATTWVELGRNINSPKTLLFNLDANEKHISDIGQLRLAKGANLTIASGEVTATHSLHGLVPESGGTDDLVTIDPGGSVDGTLLIVFPAGGYEITVKDVVQGSNISLGVTGKSLTLTGPDEGLLLRHNDGLWYEIARSKWRLDHLTGTGDVIPYTPDYFQAGTISNNTILADFIVRVPFTLRRAHGRAGTAPTSTSCVVHVKRNGSTVFASDAAAVNIAAGTQTDESDLVDVDFAVGDRCTVEATIGSSAANLGVVIEAYRTARVQP